MRKKAKKTFITVVGALVLMGGIILIPYPGPGWLVVFAGLGILATEYIWANKVLAFAKNKYNAWQAWLAKQNILTKIFFWLLTATVVVVTIWLLNGYGFINDWLRLGYDSLRSPIPIFN